MLPTICIYLGLRQAQGSSATLQGNIGRLVVRLGGPVAFYAVLLLLGKTYIPPYAEIILKGIVKDSDEQLVKEYQVTAVSYQPIPDYEGHFQLTIPRSSIDTYSFLISKGPTQWYRGPILVHDPDKIVLEGFSDGEQTKFVGSVNFKDSSTKQPLPEIAAVAVEPQIEPPQAELQGREQIEIVVKQRLYTAIFYDAQRNIFATKTLDNVIPGVPYLLPSEVTPLKR